MVNVMSKMIFKFESKLVVFTNEVINTLNEYKQYKKDQNESGGILLGKIYDKVIIIDQISTPSKDDESGRYHFSRNVQKAQKIIERSWEESNGCRIYLGEWHTHPENVPIPSIDDKILISNLVNKSDMEINYLFMVIIGREEPYVAVFDKNDMSLKKLSNLNRLEIIIYRDQSEDIRGFQIGGYLEISKYGFDIYNAGFSLIFLSVVNYFFSLGIQHYVFEKSNAFIRFINFECDMQNSIMIFDFMMLQIDMMLEQLKEKNLIDHVSIQFKSITTK